jgi:hypothetical protein
MNNEVEKIICSAIWYKDLPLNKISNKESNHTIPDSLIYPINVHQGVVFCGHRHPHCMYLMICLYGLMQHEAGEEIQGFLTSKNRFVDRKEGALIHTANGGILNYSSNSLYSEDLY